MQENKQPELNRRTVVKGAAWSLPVIVAAVATPLASASDRSARLALSSNCIQFAGVGLLPGFRVTNSGTDAYSQTITVTETIDLSSINSALVRTAFWAALTVGGLVQGANAGVAVGAWSFSGGLTPTTATRTVTVSGGLSAGTSKGWGQVLNLAGVGSLVGGSWNAVVIAPTGNPPVTQGSASQDFQLIGGCNTTPPGPPGFTETHTFLNFNYEASKWCANGQAFRPDSIDGSIADGFVFQYNDANGQPLANKDISLNIVRGNSGSFWFVTDPYAGDDRGAQLQTITLKTDANGTLKLDSSVPGMPVAGSPAYDNWGYLRYGSGSSNANLSFQVWPVEDPSKKITLDISNGSEGKHPHPGNKTRNYDGGKAC